MERPGEDGMRHPQPPIQVRPIPDGTREEKGARSLRAGTAEGGDYYYLFILLELSIAMAAGGDWGIVSVGAAQS
jgi:hypothetical protein